MYEQIVEHIVRDGFECASLLTTEVRLVVNSFNHFTLSCQACHIQPNFVDRFSI